MNSPAQFLWPVVDENATRESLIAMAADKLAGVAASSGLVLDPSAPVSFTLARGSKVPGSGGADRVVVAYTRAAAIPQRGYHQRLGSAA